MPRIRSYFWLLYGASLATLIVHAASAYKSISGRSGLADTDFRALELLVESLGLAENQKWIDECGADVHQLGICRKCPQRIECGFDDVYFKWRITRLDFSELGIVGELPRNLLAIPDALSHLTSLDVSSNPVLLQVLKEKPCVAYPICESITCEPRQVFCESSSESAIASRSLQTTTTLADAGELAAWQAFYDGAGGDRWISCGGPAARVNPCDPQICAGGGILRFILCDKFNGKLSIAQIRLENNFMRGTFNESAILRMSNLQFLWITNNAAANTSTANVLFVPGDCINVQKCYGGVMNCNFDNSGLKLCPRIFSTAPTLSPTTPPPTHQPTTLSPTHQPTTLAPTSKSPTSSSPTPQPTSKSPTSLSPTSKSPTKLPTESPTRRPTSTTPTLSPTMTRTKSPTLATSSPTLMPTRYPSASPTRRKIPQSDLAAWQDIYTALDGEGWHFCDTSFDDPCNPLVNGCVDFMYLHCNVVSDGTYRITQIFLQDNHLLGIMPDSAFQTLGPHLELLDLASLGDGNRLGMVGSCLDYQFCYQNAKCFFEGSGPILCPGIPLTPSPTLYSPIAPNELLAWQQLYETLDGPKWKGACAAGPTLKTMPCLFPNCVQCIFSGGFLHISGLLLSNVGLKGYLNDVVFWVMTSLRHIDLSNNRNAQGQGEIYADDCIRAETCFNEGTFCNFKDSGVSLCTSPLITRAPAVAGRLELAFADYIAFFWLYTDLNGPKWTLPQGCGIPDKDPCFACPGRIKCIQNPAKPSELIIQQLNLDSMNVAGAIPLVPLDHLFSRGLNQLVMTNNRLVLNEGGCIMLIPCYNGNATCDFRNSGIDLCDPPVGMPPTKTPTTPTKTPTMTAGNPCRTSGGLVREGTPCAVPFLYSSIPFSTCISFSSRPPLSTIPYELPLIPTDFWCPTVSLYNLETQNSWGFCDCSNQAPSTTPAPSSIFTPGPTLSPTKIPPPTKQPVFTPTTRSPTVPGATLNPTKSPTISQPTRSPSTSVPTFSPTKRPTALPSKTPTTSSPSKVPTTSKPSKAPTKTPVSPTPPTIRSPSTHPSKSPTRKTAQPSKSPSVSSPSKAPSRSPTGKDPTFQPTKLPTPLAPSRSPSTSRPSKTPSIAPTGKRTESPSSHPTLFPTSSPINIVSNSELEVWQQIYDSLGGSSWLQCSEYRNNPCACRVSASLFVTCTRNEGAVPQGGRRRRLQGGDGRTQITAISLPNNNASGTVPINSLEALSGLSMLDLEGNPVTLPAGSSCNDFTICSKSCKIGTVCDSTATPAPSGSRDMGGGSDAGLVAGIVILVLILVFVLLIFCIYWQCPHVLPESLKSCLDRCFARSKEGAVAAGSSCACCFARFQRSETTKKDRSGGLKEELIVAEPDDEEEEYGDPAFSRLVKQVSEKTLPSKDDQRPGGRSHFSLMKGESMPVLKDNTTLSEAKLQAMELDDMARKDVPDVDSLLMNIGLGHKIGAIKRAGVTDITSLMRLSEDRMKQIGLTMGERVKLKRTIDVRKGLLNDPVFGKGV